MMMGPVRAVGRKMHHLKTNIMTDNIHNELKTTVMKLYKFNQQQVAEFDLGKLMRLIEGRDMTIYNQFKLKLRTNGYII